MTRRANTDRPGASTALSILQLGQDEALTSRVRRVTDDHLYITPPRDGAGNSVTLVGGDLLELSWQADDGLRSVPTEVVALATDSLWKIRVCGQVTRVQRRDWVRAPIGLPIRLSWSALETGDTVEMVGSTLDLSEGGCSCVLRAPETTGVRAFLPRYGQRMRVALDMYSDVVDIQGDLRRRVPRDDALHEWSLTFVGLPEQTADLIRSHVFTALRNARARSIRALY